jgi:multiple sugar transport system ATP-binding protein
MATITLNDVTKRFQSPEGETVAADGVDLSVNEGEFLVLVGPSGCGKTTTLRMIAGLETPDEGSITFDGRDVIPEEPHERNVAMVFQSYALYPHMTVRSNIGYGLRKSASLSGDEITEQVDEIAELMGIADHLSKKPGQLSGGQKQRVATGRALVRNPAVFLLDEPLSNLDAKLRLHMRTEIQRIQDDFGTTTVYVTHDQEEAMTMGDRIAVMRSGGIQQVGTPNEIYDDPRTEFVARFVGNPSMNFFDAAVSEDALETPAFSIDLQRSTASPTVDPGEYRLGMRPEAIDLTPDASGGATVSVVEPTGSDAVVYVDKNGVEVTVKMSRSDAPDEGDDVAIHATLDSVYLFDPASGETVYNGTTRSTDSVVANNR